MIDIMLITVAHKSSQHSAFCMRGGRWAHRPAAAPGLPGAPSQWHRQQPRTPVVGGRTVGLDGAGILCVGGVEEALAQARHSRRLSELHTILHLKKMA